ALVAVPSRPASERERGYRHVEILARLAVRAASDPSGPPPRSEPPDLRLLRALRTGAGRADQVGLGRAERLANARRTEVRAGSRAALAGRRVWLVDDLATTGASLDGARRALRAAGARAELAVVCAAVVARADPAS
ncbi:ComF family protein, partial [Leucobacter sp. M11]|uniref:ComF family protein n=1 Tax=Leucobacter sp. M11 TaxID=2993565 RepID=UPI002DA79870|nr:phosphoribosyltransferase family protein [Leucobacter sp. M11]